MAKPAAHQGDASLAAAEGAVGPATFNHGTVHINGFRALRLADPGIYPVCNKGVLVRWWACEGYANVRINGLEASGGSLMTGSADGPGSILPKTQNVFIGGPTITMQERARQAALARMERALQSLHRWNAADRANFRKWFGTDSEEARLEMIASLEQMRNKLASADLDMGAKDNCYGHVFRTSNTVSLDPHFWSAPPDDDSDTQAGVLIHESSHFSDTAGTHDWVYGEEDCEKLAKIFPNYAMNNADSYEYFCEHLP